MLASTGVRLEHIYRGFHAKALRSRCAAGGDGSAQKRQKVRPDAGGLPPRSCGKLRIRVCFVARMPVCATEANRLQFGHAGQRRGGGDCLLCAASAGRGTAGRVKAWAVGFKGGVS